ncbi:MAG: SDR family oxidoreductase [Hyphomicrobiaceae bacterium]
MDLQGKTIVITGAAQGLGRKMVEMVAAHGANVALVDVDQAKLTEAVGKLEKAGRTARSYRTDVTSESAVEALFVAVRRDFGRVDGLINNAGITHDGLLVKTEGGKISRKMSLADFNKVIAVDLTAVFLCGREAAVHMIEGDHGGVIVNISSISRAGNVGQSNYTAAKAAIAAMSVTWAKELARYKIRCAGIAPGFCNTRMVAAIPPKIQERITSTLPLRRFGEPDEIAGAALFVLENDYFDGRILEIDGGLRL